MLTRLLMLSAFAFSPLALAQETPAQQPQPAAEPAQEGTPVEIARPRVALRTNMGDIVIELYEDKAPKSAANFLQYVRDGHYDGTIFHRVIDNFMVQGGGFTGDLQQKSTRAPIENEANNGLSNQRGTVAMARTTEPHSALSQFFINVVDNPRLDYVSDQNGLTWGYAVFGRVIEGMDVIDRIRALETGPQGPFAKDVPKQPVVIQKAEVLDVSATREAARGQDKDND
jgi:cyclophilin family peptidyl-prolyl cis-trans isomerase